jgi:hypothetical protein
VKKLLMAAASLLLLAASDNSAVAVNTKNDSTLIKVSFKITRIAGDVIDPTNIAFAYSSCTSCETVAIAIQGVLVFGTDATTITPTNEAFAINWGCNGCSTMADAIQFTYTETGPVHFTPEGQRELAEIRRQLEAIAHSEMTLDQIAVAVQQIQAELAQVLATQVVPSGQSGQDQGQATPASSPSGSPGQASPSASPQPSLSPSPAVTPAPSPSA